MSPVNNHITNQLRQLIYYNLDCNNLQNALFLAGRLHAYEPRASEAAYLLALCYLRLNQFRAAYDYSKNSGSRGTHLGCSYIFAQACHGLEKYSEGVTALERSKTLWAGKSNWNKHTEVRRQHLPDAAAVYCLQAKLLHAHEDTNRAIECYAEALKLNPFMWDAFVGLCDLGVNVRMANIFRVTSEMMDSMGGGGNEETSLGILDDLPTQNLSQSGDSDPFSVSTNRANGDNRFNIGKTALFEKLNGSSNLITPVGPNSGAFEGMETPTGLGSAIAAPLLKPKTSSVSLAEDVATIEPPHAPLRKARAMAGLGMDFGTEAPPRLKASSLRSKTRGNFHGPIQSEDLDTGNPTFPILSSGITERKRTASGQVSASSAIPPTHVNNGTNDPAAPQRRSVRLHNLISRPQSKLSSSNQNLGVKDGREIKRAKATGLKGRNTHGTVGRVVSGNRKYGDPMDVDSKEVKPLAGVPPPATKSAANDRAKEYESLQWLVELFMKLGSGYFFLSHYRCHDAIQMFNSLPTGQKETPWVLAQMGRALYEQASYAEAERYYARIRSMAPARLEDMEVYSTVLWHLKREIDLSFLAHEVIDIDRLSPQAWCTVGNSFSLQRDHDQALKCFKRATQLDPKFAYAFTLQGHEHVANEEYDKAMASYRSGIAAEHRHYNAWYGLARVYEKQGKYEVAEQHYRTAAAINPTNAILICCIGAVLERLKRPQQALDQYTRSCELAPRSNLARFRKARVLVALNRPELALAELNVLKDIAPDEANVHFLLGRVYKIMRQKGDAIKHFTTALNLDPKVRFYWLADGILSSLLTVPNNRHPTPSKKPWSKWKTKRTTRTMASWAD